MLLLSPPAPPLKHGSEIELEGCSEASCVAFVKGLYGLLNFTSLSCLGPVVLQEVFQLAAKFDTLELVEVIGDELCLHLTVSTSVDILVALSVPEIPSLIPHRSTAVCFILQHLSEVIATANFAEACKTHPFAVQEVFASMTTELGEQPRGRKRTHSGEVLSSSSPSSSSSSGAPCEITQDLWIKKASQFRVLE